MDEVAPVLARLAEHSPNMLLQSCRRIIEYFPAAGPAWWLAARALAGADPAEEIDDAVEELGSDPTGRLLADALPAGSVAAVGPVGDAVRRAFRHRPDVKVAKKLGPAGLLLVTAQAGGPSSLLVSARAAQAVSRARSAGKPVWGVVPRGTALPGPLWESLLALAAPGEDTTVVAVMDAGVLEVVVGDQGKAPPPGDLARPGCPPVAELLGWRI